MGTASSSDRGQEALLSSIKQGFSLSHIRKNGRKVAVLSHPEQRYERKMLGAKDGILIQRHKALRQGLPCKQRVTE